MRPPDPSTSSAASGSRASAASRRSRRSTGRCSPRSRAPDAGDVDRAVRAAHDAFPAWAALGPAGRAEHLHRLADLIDANIERLAEVECADMAMLLRSLRARVIARGALNYRNYADLAVALRGARLALEGHVEPRPADAGRPGGGHHAVERAVHALHLEDRAGAGRGLHRRAQARRVVAAVVLAARRARRRGGPAARRAQRRAGHRRGGRRRARLAPADPPRVVHRLDRDRAATSAPRPRRTSSRSPPSSAARTRSSSSTTPTSTPPRARPPASTTTPARSACRARGCSSQESVRDEFLERFHAAADEHVLGDPRDDATTISPMIHPDHVARVEGFVERAQADGQKIVRGGRRLDGLFYEPTLIEPTLQRRRDRPARGLRPRADLQTFASEEEAIALANSTAYGLAGLIYTSSLGRADRVGRAVRGGHGVGQHVPRARPHRAVRRHGQVGHRARGRRLRARLLLGPQDPPDPRRIGGVTVKEESTMSSTVQPPAAAAPAARRRRRAAASPAARHRPPRLLHRRGVRAADRGRRRSGGDVPRHGQPGHPVPVHPAGDHPRHLRRRLRGDEPPRRRRRRVLHLRRAWSGQDPGRRRGVHRARLLQRDADRHLRPVRRRDRGRSWPTSSASPPQWYVWCFIGVRDRRRARRAADRPQRAGAGRRADPRGHRHRDLRLRDPRRPGPAGPDRRRLHARAPRPRRRSAPRSCSPSRRSSASSRRRSTARRPRTPSARSRGRRSSRSRAIGVFYALSSWLLANAVGPDTIVNPEALVEGGFTTPDGAAPDPTTVLFIAGARPARRVLRRRRARRCSARACSPRCSRSTTRSRGTSSRVGREGVFPKAFGRVHPRTGAPFIGSMTQSVAGRVGHRGVRDPRGGPGPEALHLADEPRHARRDRAHGA